MLYVDGKAAGVETRFTNGLDVNPRSRPVFAFHKPETLADWLADAKLTDRASAEASVHQRSAKSLRGGMDDSAESPKVAEAAPEYIQRGPTFLSRMQHMPPLEEKDLWPAQPIISSTTKRRFRMFTPLGTPTSQLSDGEPLPVYAPPSTRTQGKPHGTRSIFPSRNASR